MQVKQLKFNNHTFKVNLRDQADASVFAEIFELREYRSAESIIKSAHFPIIDAGAHAGFFVLYCRALNAKIKIYALEPETENAQFLAKHLKSNRIHDVKIFQQALAGKSVIREFFVSEDTHNHSLIKPVKYKEKISVNSESLSEFLTNHKLDRVSLLKLDIEGAEYEVLENLAQKDWPKLGNILLEYHDLPEKNHQQLAELIRRNGFSLEIFPSHYDNKLGYMLARNKIV
ncbi:MAG: FkbM family methyltransferase [Candidatus Parcubacteria bacterium]|nr:FkbM family methyltransferase [Candidatus Parcubacteria bacterium]